VSSVVSDHATVNVNGSSQVVDATPSTRVGFVEEYLVVDETSSVLFRSRREGNHVCMYLVAGAVCSHAM
jgi:hypothetical protein